MAAALSILLAVLPITSPLVAPARRPNRAMRCRSTAGGVVDYLLNDAGFTTSDVYEMVDRCPELETEGAQPSGFVLAATPWRGT